MRKSYQFFNADFMAFCIYLSLHSFILYFIRIMKKAICILLFMVYCIVQLTAQTELRINTPIQATDVLYDKFEYLDSRPDKNYIGEDVIENPPISVQLQALVSDVMKGIRDGHTLVFQMRDIFFWKGKTSEGKNAGFCHIRLNLYDRTGNDYYFINRIDTLIETKPKEIYKAVSDAFSSILASNLSALRLGDVPFTLDGVMDIDNFEKQDIPLFVNEKLTDGIYINYEDFANQTPDKAKMKVEMNKNGSEVKKVSRLNLDGKLIKVEPQYIYAVVVDEQPYIVYDGKYWLGYRTNNDVQFNIKRKVNAGNGGVSVDIGGGGGSRGGGIGAGIGFTFGSKKTVTQLMKIDHLSGNAQYAE